jgi:hypothetical protein
VTELSDDELSELRGLILSEIGGDNAVDDVELATLEELADASVTVSDEATRREQEMVASCRGCCQAGHLQVGRFPARRRSLLEPTEWRTRSGWCASS